jgi:signal transduction histidine kinase
MKTVKKIDEILERLEAGERKNIFKYLRDAGLFRNVFNNIREGIVLFDRRLNIQFANFAAREMFGFPEDFLEQKISLYLKGIQWEVYINATDGIAANVSRREIEILYPQRKILLYYIVPYDAERGVYIVIFHDVTGIYDTKQIQIENEKNDMISLLAAEVAHEIGNPLNSIAIHLQLLEKKLIKEKNKKRDELELLKIARLEMSRLENIIKRFLQSTRIKKTNFERVNVKKILMESLTLLELEIKNKLIKIQWGIIDGIPPVKGDAGQLKQAFQNIIKNAIQAMKEGGELGIFCESSDNLLKISFKDSGSGIDPKLIDKIFNPYFSTKADGSGLGLMIANKIIREHNGKISVDSSLGKWSRFTVELPLFDKTLKLLPFNTGGIATAKKTKRTGKSV